MRGNHGIVHGVHPLTSHVCGDSETSAVLCGFKSFKSHQVEVRKKVKKLWKYERNIMFPESVLITPHLKRRAKKTLRPPTAVYKLSPRSLSQSSLPRSTPLNSTRRSDNQRDSSCSQSTRPQRELSTPLSLSQFREESVVFRFQRTVTRRRVVQKPSYKNSR